jgi:alkylation response protein AidB-like acyl-CoA dehydrogenase
VAVASADETGLPCLVLVDSRASRIHRGPPIKKTGLEAIHMFDATFDDVVVEDGDVLPGDAPLLTLAVWLELLLGADSVGAASDFFDILCAWSEDRTIKGGAKLKENPLCTALLSLVAGEIATATLLVFDLAGMVAEDAGVRDGSPSEQLFAFARTLGLRVQRSAFTAIDRGMELMGSAGYSKEWHAEKHWRDVKTIKAVLCGAGGEVPAQLDGARYFLRCEEV